MDALAHDNGRASIVLPFAAAASRSSLATSRETTTSDEKMISAISVWWRPPVDYFASSRRRILRADGAKDAARDGKLITSVAGAEVIEMNWRADARLFGRARSGSGGGGAIMMRNGDRLLLLLLPLLIWARLLHHPTRICLTSLGSCRSSNSSTTSDCHCHCDWNHPLKLIGLVRQLPPLVCS